MAIVDALPTPPPRRRPRDAGTQEPENNELREAPNRESGSSPVIPSQCIDGVLEVHAPDGETSPLVIDSPHSGNVGQAGFDPRLAQRWRLSADAFVDELFASAPGHGATLLRALFPRAFIDLNRSPLDLDEAMLEEAWPEPLAPSEKARLGIGLIASRDATGPLYERKLRVAEVRHRLDNYYWPYHRTLRRILDSAYRGAGVVYHLNCHSMKSPVSHRTSSKSLDFCLGDRDGSSAGREFTRFVAGTVRDLGYHVEINDPYKGVELVRRYSDPAMERHSVQIEVNRALYMDERLVTRHEGFRNLRADMDRLIGRIAAYARARRVFADAAE